MFTKNDTLSTDLSTAIPQQKKVFVIIVHFGDVYPTNIFIASLLDGSVVPEHIIVVDHAEVAYKCDNPIVSCIRPLSNNGYASGLRVGLGYAQTLAIRATDICMLVNNDAVFGVRSVEKIVTWWGVRGSVHVLAGPSMGSLSRITGRSYIYKQDAEIPFWHTRYIHGSCMVAEYQALVRANLFEYLFLYWEDVAISTYFSSKGGVLAHIPDVEIVHDDTVSALSDEKLYYLVRNGAHVLERHLPYGLRVYWRIINGMRLIYHSMRTGKKHTIVYNALRDARNLGIL